MRSGSALKRCLGATASDEDTRHVNVVRQHIPCTLHDTLQWPHGSRSCLRSALVRFSFDSHSILFRRSFDSHSTLIRSSLDGNVDVLDLKVLIDAYPRPLTPEPALLDSAEGGHLIRNDAGVHAHDAVLQRLGDSPNARVTIGVEVRREAVRRVIGCLDHLRKQCECRGERVRAARDGEEGPGERGGR